MFTYRQRGMTKIFVILYLVLATILLVVDASSNVCIFDSNVIHEQSRR